MKVTTSKPKQTKIASALRLAIFKSVFGFLKSVNGAAFRPFLMVKNYQKSFKI